MSPYALACELGLDPADPRVIETCRVLVENMRTVRERALRDPHGAKPQSPPSPPLRH